MATANPEDFIKLGYGNGNIPECALADIPGQLNPRTRKNYKLHPAAKEQVVKLMNAATLAGVPFKISSAYRSYETQTSVKAEKGVAAANPGESKHGWGTTIDIAELYTLAESTANQLNKTLPANKKLNRASPEVNQRVRETSKLYQWLSQNAPKYGWVNPEWAKDGKGIIDECWHWEYQAWPTLPSYVQFKPSTERVTTICPEDTPISTKPTRPTSTAQTPESNITPYIGSLESFHPRIQYELTRRRISAETANTYMPFVKLTSLTNVLGNNIPGGASGSIGDAWCPTLGPHGEDNVSFENIYLAKNNINDINLPQSNRSIIGYATTAIGTLSEEDFNRIPVIVEETAVSTDQRNIPMPGIVEVSAERSTAGPMGVRGGLMKADVKILAYSVGQVDTLLRYFLRPATRVVLEWGRKSSNTSEQIKPYNWAQSSKAISDTFTDIIKSPESGSAFIKEHVYNSNGNYEIFIGYVVKFDLKYNKNNIYEISLTVHSVQQFEIPVRHTGVKSLCESASDPCAAMDILEYFSDDYSWKQKTFKKLMAKETEEKNKNADYTWAKHFISLKNSETTDTGPGSKTAGMDEDEYLVSWRFFVEKILNDDNLGIASLITDTNTKNFIKTGLIKPTRTITDTEVEVQNSANKLIANEVGWHPDLRSTNPNVLVIYNQSAQNRRTQTETSNYLNLISEAEIKAGNGNNFRNQTRFEKEIKLLPPFKNKTKDNTNQPAVGSLTEGIWLNTKAIKQAFTSNDTVSGAINTLLTMMNGATEGYWNLQLYSTDRPNAGMFVIDWGLSKPLVKNTNNIKFPWIDREEKEENSILSSVGGVNISRYQKSNEGNGQDEPRYIYMFNRGTKRFNDGELGSDILDLNVEFNLPQVVAVQAIAGVGGPAQKSTLQSIDIPQLNKITLIKDIFPPCDKQNLCLDDNCRDRDLLAAKAQLDAANEQLKGVKNKFQDAYVTGGPEVAGAVALMGAQTVVPQIQEAKTKYNTVIFQRSGYSPMVIDTVRELSSLGTLLDYVEFNPSAMMKKLNRDSRTSESGQATPYAHAFNSSNLTKTIVNVTLPGIGGIELFQSFLVDRVPSILKLGFYVVTKVIHKFSPDRGWLTTVEGRFRYRPENEGTGKGYPVCGAPSGSAGEFRGVGSTGTF